MISRAGAVLTGLEKKQRAPDVRSLGVSLIAAGVVVTVVEGQDTWLPGAVIVAAGFAWYYPGIKWE
jgi:hypothetical protein